LIPRFLRENLDAHEWVILADIHMQQRVATGRSIFDSSKAALWDEFDP